MDTVLSCPINATVADMSSQLQDQYITLILGSSFTLSVHHATILDDTTFELKYETE